MNRSGTPPPAAAPPLRFELGLTPAAPGRSWHAALRAVDGARVHEFDSPFELLRYLEQITEDRRPDGRLR